MLWRAFSSYDDRKSLLALRGVGPESEAESVRFHGPRVTKVAQESNTGFLGLRGGPVNSQSSIRNKCSHWRKSPLNSKLLAP